MATVGFKGLTTSSSSIVVIMRDDWQQTVSTD